MKLKFWEKKEPNQEDIQEESDLPEIIEKEDDEKSSFFSNISQKIGNFREKKKVNKELAQEEIILPDTIEKEDNDEVEKTGFFSNIGQTLGDYWDKSSQGLVATKNFVSETYDEHFITKETAIKILIKTLPTIVKLVAIAAAVPSPQTKTLLLALPILKGSESYYSSNYKIIDDKLIKIKDEEFSLDLKESISDIMPVVEGMKNKHPYGKALIAGLKTVIKK